MVKKLYMVIRTGDLNGAKAEARAIRIPLSEIKDDKELQNPAFSTTLIKDEDQGVRMLEWLI